MGKKSVGFGALAIACAPVVASATVLFEDNFDANSSARYDQFIFDRANGNDAAATFAFDYGAFQHWTSDTGGSRVSAPIPAAPRSVGGTTIGLRLDVNNDSTAPSPNTAVINLYPKLTEYLNDTLPSGDHKMTVDVWMNYNGGYEGGGGSTEHMSIGLNQQGGGIGGGTPAGLTPPGGPFNGLGWTVNGERGNAFDYRYWRANTRIGGADALDPEVGQIAQDEGPGNPGPADGRNQFYQQAFPFLNPNNASEVWYETPGSIGKHWTTAQMIYEDGIIYHYLLPDGSTNPPILIAARTEESIVSGHVMLGYLDLNNGSAALEDGEGTVAPHDANFVVFDNLVVETITQTRQKWNFNGGGNWSEGGKWDNGEPNAVTHVADFTTALAAPAVVNVDGARTVRSIVFDSGNGYTISGGNTITIDSLTTGIFGTLKSRSGSHTISAPVVLNRPAIFDVSAGSELAVTNINANGFRLVKNGVGTATVNHLRAPSLTVNAGTMRVAPDSTAAGTSVLPALTLAAGAKLDLTNNKLITAASAGTASGTTYGGVQGLVQSGHNAGAWNGAGIITSQADAAAGLTSIGVGNAGQILALGAGATGTFGGQTVADTDTIVMYTYRGDANLDGFISGDDYSAIDFAAGTPGASGWTNGDFNWDGIISGDDYSAIDFNIVAQGAPFPTGGADGGGLAGVTAVPEPASALALGVLGIGLAARRRRVAGR